MAREKSTKLPDTADERDDATPWVVIAGGGTGGHVYPAIAIADALVDTGCDRSALHFIGSKRALEATVVPGRGYTITLLPGRGIARKLTRANVRATAGLLLALVEAFMLLVRRRPRVVVSVGGYAAAPAAFSAILLRIPLVLAESNAVPGAVHRIAGRFSRANAVAWPGTKLPHPVVTGNPVRSDLVEVDRGEPSRLAARDRLGLPRSRVVIASFGGSLGSGTINRSMRELAELWRDRDDIALYHVVGKRDWRDVSKRADVDEKARLFYKCVPYEDDMPSFYAAADIVVSRSGATTSSEIAAVGVPSVLVPLPNAPGDHQSANARALEEAGASVVIPDSACNGPALAAVLEQLISDPSRLERMGDAAKAFARPDAAVQVARLVVDVVNGPKR